EIDAMAGFAQSLDERERVGPALFLGDDDVEIASVLAGQPGIALCRRGGDVCDEIGEDDIAHAEAERWQIDFAVAHQAEQLVVAPAASECAFVFAAIEDLEDDAGVIGEAADDGKIDINKVY